MNKYHFILRSLRLGILACVGICGFVTHLMATELVETAPFAADALTCALWAVQDGNSAIAITNATRVLSATDVSTADRLSALELLLRDATERKAFSAVLAMLEQYSELVALDPSWRFKAFRANALAALGAKADLKLEAIPDKSEDPWTDWCLRIHARSAARNKDTNAIQLFERIDSSTNVVTRTENAIDWGNYLMAQGKPEEAIARLLPLTTPPFTNDVQIKCALVLAAFYHQAHQTDAALKLLNQVANDATLTTTQRLPALLQLSHLAQVIGDRTLALDTARKAQTFDESDAYTTRAWLAELLLGDRATFEEGGTLSRQLIREKPSAPEAPRLLLALAEASYRYDAYPDALAAYTQYAEAYHEPALEAQIQEGRAKTLLALKRPAEAAPCFARAAELSKQDALRYRRCREAEAQAAYDAKQFTYALDLYRALSNTTDTGTPAPTTGSTTLHAGANVPPLSEETRAFYLFMQADIEERLGHDSEAIALFKQVVTTYTTTSYMDLAAVRLGGLLAETHQFDEAIARYSETIENTTNTAIRMQAYLERGRVYHEIFRLDLAVEDFRKVESASPTPELQENAQFFLVLSLYGLGRDSEARTAAERYQMHYPDSKRIPDILLWLGKSDFNAGYYSQARVAFTSFVLRFPTHAQADAALLWSARAAVALKDYTGAVDLCARLARDYPKSPWLAETRFVQAESLIEQARFTDALLVLNTIIKNYPDKAWIGEVYGRKADCLFSTATDVPERYSEAIDAYREALTRTTGNPDLALQYQYKIGRAYEKQKKPQEAINQYYENVIQRFLLDREKDIHFSDSGRTCMMKALYQFSELATASGRRDEAINVLRRVLRARIPNTGDVSTWLNRLERK